jgi:FAD-dependent urate hydroxylase
LGRRFGAAKAMTSERADRLRDLERRANDEMARIEGLSPQWVDGAQDQQGKVHPVVICGAGLSGLSIAFALKRRGVPALVIDQSEAGAEGPWGLARMATLRSPKYLSGLDLGVPSLTVRSWYEAIHGAEAWESLGRLGRTDWIDYLNWFRKAARVEVENGARLVAVEPGDKTLALTLETAGGARRIAFCRRLVLATGIDGCGGPHVPGFVKALPKSAWAHSSEPIDIGLLADQDVAILGSGTSSFDWAVAALEAKARSVMMFGRSVDFPRTEVLAWTNFPGLLGAFAELPDRDRWRFARLYFRFKVPPTQDQYDRALSRPNFTMRLGRPISGLAMAGEKVRLATDDGETLVDRLLLGTGYALDFARRPELASLADAAAFWEHRFLPPPGEDDPFLASHPYLGPGFELTPRRSGADDWVSRVHLFNPGALVSLGPISNGVTGLKYGAPRIAAALVKALFTEDAPRYLAALAAYSESHFDPRLGDARSTDPDNQHDAHSRSPSLRA